MRFRKKPRIIYNDDTCSLRRVNPPHTERKMIARTLGYLQDTQVDCLCWSVTACDIAYSWPSQVLESPFVKEGTNRHSLDPGHDLMLSLYRRGIDYLPLLVENCRRRGIRFIASFRMNDIHHRSHPRGFGASEFWTTHQQWRLWEVTDARTYYNAALDYSYRQVRKRKLDAIREFVDRYDVDGIEIDWCREPYTFPPSVAWSKRDVLTAFQRDVTRIRAAAARRRGRKIDLIIRVPVVEERLIKAGMAVDTWIKRKYMDVLVMSHLTNNYNVRFQPWLSRCHEKGVLFYGSVEAGPATNAAHNYVVPVKPDEVVKRQRAAAQNILAQGADGVYMFNHPCILYEHQWSPAAFRRLTGILVEMGQLKTLRGKAKQYTYWQDLPLSVESNRPARFHQTIGFTIRDSSLRNRRNKIVLSFRQIAEKNPHAAGPYRQDPIVPAGWVKYYLNGRAIGQSRIRRTRQPGGRIPSGFTLKSHELIELTPAPSMLVNGENTLAFYIPRFPGERDPYVFIYELTVSVTPSAE